MVIPAISKDQTGSCKEDRYNKARLFGEVIGRKQRNSFF